MKRLSGLAFVLRQGALPMLAAIALGCGSWSAAQTSPPAPAATSTTGQKKATAHKKRSHAVKPVVDPLPAEVHPPDPPPPDWPVNAKAEPASVGWDGRALSIQATNASLQQILRDVSTATGVKVDGVTNGPVDQRVFGSYGPAPARDVLSSLLAGSGYNVLMVGDQGEGTPRELVLTAKAHGTGSGQQANGQANGNNEDDSPEEPENPEQPDPMMHRPGGLGGMSPQPGQNRSPQQMIQELQRRQQQQQDQQQQQQQQQAPPPGQPQTPPQSN